MPGAGVSASLCSLPAFETERTLFIAEARLRRVARGRPCRRSTALQAVSDAYVARRAGDRGDNLARAASLLTRAAALPAERPCEKLARASALARLARALLALAEGPRGPALRAASDEKKHGADKPAKRSAWAEAALAASDGASAALKSMDESDAKEDAADAERRNLHAMVLVDKARAMCVGLEGSDGADEKRVAAVAALEAARALRASIGRRERAACAFADVLLAELHVAGHSNEGRTRAAQLLNGARGALDGLFGGGDDSKGSPESGKVAPDSDCSSGSLGSEEDRDDEEEEGGEEVICEEDGHECGKTATLDPLAPFEGWDVDEVRNFIAEEIERLGMAESTDERRSCVIC